MGDRIAELLGRAGVAPAGPGGEPWAELAGGTYNTLLRVRRDDGGPWCVLKAPPAAGTPGMSHERGLLQNELTYFRVAAGGPVPEVLYADDDCLLMSELPGRAWHEAALAPEEVGFLRRQLGSELARVHRVAGPGFGYPGGALGPLAPDWRSAFTGMLDALFADAERYGAWLPRPLDEIRALTARAAGALDEVTAPAPVHFDLWEGNLLVDGAPGAYRLSGVIDAERMFFGDPLADLVSLGLFGRAEEDAELMAGLGWSGVDAGGRTRLALYRTYLYTIMLTETVPRGSDEEGVRWTREHAGGALADALARL
ncbi:phosphotransferase family protein [Streptomyces sp. NPDC060194]|uniref:phosphotransferase family protein n=1 Tax=Streptomyces sp. NPDC060194 TaxID=3347069 RepID=UPI00365FA156